VRRNWRTTNRMRGRFDSTYLVELVDGDAGATWVEEEAVVLLQRQGLSLHLPRWSPPFSASASALLHFRRISPDLPRPSAPAPSFFYETTTLLAPGPACRLSQCSRDRRSTAARCTRTANDAGRWISRASRSVQGEQVRSTPPATL
jgi:hypothetical protein